jgi:hypothetical protein
MDRLKAFAGKITGGRKLELGRKQGAALAMTAAALGIYAVSKGEDATNRKLVDERTTEFKRSRMLGDPYASVAKAKERQLDKSARDYSDAQKSLGEGLSRIDGRLADLERRVSTMGGQGQPAAGAPPPTSAPQDAPSVAPAMAKAETGTLQVVPSAGGSTQFVAPGEPRQPLDIRPMLGSRPSPQAYIRQAERPEEVVKGPAVITFPVKGEELRERTEVVLPPGAYVKGKMLTGVEAPEGTPYPVLIQLDFANILPNRKTLDLSGCFIIAKAEGNLSIERVKMQATKLSCVARDGRMFERDVNGFVADAGDNSFGIIGEVNTKQDRVAAMAFLSSVVDGAGRAIQMAQTTQQTTPLGGTQSVMTGDQAKYIGAGGAASAGNMVAQWYLKQAQGLLPTINVGSGKDIWLVMQESVSLPAHYFKKIQGGRDGKDASFVSRLLDQ